MPDRIIPIEPALARFSKIVLNRPVALVEIYGPMSAFGIRLQVVDPPGGEWLPQDPADIDPPDLSAGAVITPSIIKPFRFIQTSISIWQVIINTNPVITGWADAFTDYQSLDVGSDIGFHDTCLFPDTGAYIGDVGCEGVIRPISPGSPIIAGGVERHTRITDVLNEYRDGGDSKRVIYAFFDAPDHIAKFALPDEGEPGQTVDFSFFRPQNAIVEDEILEDYVKHAWLVNWAFSGPERPIKINLITEEPEEGGEIEGYIRFRRWSTGSFKILNDFGRDGTITTYNGTSSPSVDQQINTIRWDSTGFVAQITKDGFVSS